ncbi:MAG: hypothetical protein AAGA66_12010 [Bacteroidota bacterium]
MTTQPQPQPEKISQLIASLERITGYRHLDETDYLLIRELITSCKYQLSKSDRNHPKTEYLRKTIEKLDAFFFRLEATTEVL